MGEHSVLGPEFNDTKWMDLPHNLLSHIARHVKSKKKPGVVKDGSVACLPWFNLYVWWEPGYYSEKKEHIQGGLVPNMCRRGPGIPTCFSICFGLTDIHAR